MANAVTLPGERLAGLSADLFHKLQSGNLTLDELALFNQRKNSFGTVAKQLFKRLSATIALPAVTNFVAREHFIVDSSENAKVKIGYLGEKFKANFLPKIENNEVIAEDLTVNKLLENSFDPAIITALGGVAKVGITLGQYFAVFAKQPNGKKGVLLTNGYANVGYVRDINGVLCALRGDWDDLSNSNGWGFEAFPLGDPDGWIDDYQFLSR